MKKIGPVNLRAQYLHNNMTDRREVLQKQRKEFEQSLKKTEAVLDQMIASKDYKVQFTFTQVANYFKEVFPILVPNGRAELVFERFCERRVSEANNNRPSAIDIKVSFNGNDEMTQLSALSGGQKSLVALAYMFALQKCDPCPIYVFDEIDANLDGRSRRAIAEWLIDTKSNAESPPQFITTTFRRELMENADKVIGVTMMHKASHIKVLDSQEAMEFITQYCTE